MRLISLTCFSMATAFFAGNMAGLCLAEQTSPTAAAFPVEKLPPGFVRGDVVSYSYVPNRYWGRAEAIGICPYLFEYGIMKFEGDKPLEQYHDENIRRIDMVSKWSTCIGLYNRYDHFRDEIINLMIRCFKNRQLIILSAIPNPQKKSKDSLENLVAILETLWEHRDRELVSPEGDRATGRQLINNILAAATGDEGLSGLKTEGLAEINRMFKAKVKDRLLNGERPFAHIKTWYNEMQFGMGTYAANEEQLNKQNPNQGPQKWPANSEFIGVDTYHYWTPEHVPFDPDDPSVPRSRIIENAVAWQNVITRYYGPDFRVTFGDKWDPKNRNDTHAMLQAIDLAGADRAMMIYIGNTDNLPNYYTTPIETMDAFYDSIKAGPWVGLTWYHFDPSHPEFNGAIDYLDKTLTRYKPGSKKRVPYTEAELEQYRQRFIASRMRMFNDVVYGQFGYLNGPTPRK